MPIEIIPSACEVLKRCTDWKSRGLSVGLVPTMGALHDGHMSLVRASAGECGRTVVSIYVNPTQFGRGEDLSRYPRRLQADAAAAAAAGAHAVFAPSDGEMYPEGFCTHVAQEGLTEVLEGAARPGHFRGVLTVVLKLLNLVPADRAYFGRKDFQQAVVVRRMVRDLNVPVQVRVMPTVREADGLAMSSRNEYLSAQERAQAVCLYEALQEARQAFGAGERSAARLAALIRRTVERRPAARLQYAEIVDPTALRPVPEAHDDSVAVLAAFVGSTRLIDNMTLGGECE